MKNRSLGLLLGATFWLFACSPCTGPNQVHIAATDATPPELTWYVIQKSMTPSGPISAITPYTGAAVNVSASRTDSIWVYLVARDAESGVFDITMSGGFGMTCNSGTGAIALDGIIPEQYRSLSPAGPCGSLQIEVDRALLDVGMACPAGNTFANMGFGMSGRAANNKGGEATSTLSLTVNP